MIDERLGENMGRLFVAEWNANEEKKQASRYVPSKKQLTRLVFNWVFRNAGHLTVRDVSYMMEYVLLHIKTCEGHADANLEIVQ